MIESPIEQSCLSAAADYCKIFTVSFNHWEGSKIHSNFTIRVYRNFQYLP